MAMSQGGFVTRAQARQLGGRHIVDDALNDGVLTRVFPGVYVVTGAVAHRRLMHRAALAYLPGAALSHLDALEFWGLGAAEPAIHVTAPLKHRAIAAPGLVVHRRKDFRCEPPAVVGRDGLRVVRLERALVESWPLTAEADRRSPLITALRDRRTTAARVTAALDESPRLAGAAEMRRLVALVAGGCHSELEVWGHEKVFADPRLPPSHRQFRVQVDGRTVFLDRYFAAERVAVELDGAAWHGSRQQRERDLRRDAALAAMGILVVRFSHRRLVAEPEKVIEELCRILAWRRAQAVAM
jgi:very-short-patch-repair endonuclease/predicted transcriptional regulator of viral defense system